MEVVIRSNPERSAKVIEALEQLNIAIADATQSVHDMMWELPKLTQPKRVRQRRKVRDWE